MICDVFNPSSYVKVVFKHISVLKLKHAAPKVFSLTLQVLITYLFPTVESSVTQQHIKRKFGNLIYLFWRFYLFFLLHVTKSDNLFASHSPYHFSHGHRSIMNNHTRKVCQAPACFSFYCPAPIPAVSHFPTSWSLKHFLAKWECDLCQYHLDLHQTSARRFTEKKGTFPIKPLTLPVNAFKDNQTSETSERNLTGNLFNSWNI